MLLLLLAVCLAPVAASYFTYYVIKPRGGTTNYGELITPQRPVPEELRVVDEHGAPMPLNALLGKWLMISVDRSACDQACVTKLYFMRQVRATQGVERGRVVTVFLRTDRDEVPAVVRKAYPDTRMLSAAPQALADWLPAGADGRVEDHIYLVDPLGNLMMRFPRHVDPNKLKNDLDKLLRISTIG
jgi:hypothetical protein